MSALTEIEIEAVMVKMARALRIALRLLEKWERLGGRATEPMNKVREALKAYEELP